MNSDAIIRKEMIMGKFKSKLTFIFGTGDLEDVESIIDFYEQKVNQLETNRDEVIECINNFDVFKEFSFPLMKRDEENQVKSSIDYEFKTTLYKELLSILERGKE